MNRLMSRLVPLLQLRSSRGLVWRCQSGDQAPRAPTLTILHFNDVYNVEEQPTEPKAGAARFKTAIDSFSAEDPLVLFSGDVFAPSILSSFTQGQQMVTVLNHIAPDCAVFGNHDFDFGLEQLLELSGKTNFPWLMSNVVDNETEEPLANGATSHVLWHKGYKIGILGLVEKEWLDTLSTINEEEVTFTDYVERGEELAKELRDQGCHYVIALTHMRTPNDVRLAEGVEGIDLILGGHDHCYEVLKINGKMVVKSGTDFREFSRLVLTPGSDGDLKVDVERIEVDGRFAPHEGLKEELSHYESVVEGKMGEVLGHFSVPLDGRFATIRTQESNLGNFVCDIIMSACEADVAVLNSGTLRSDRIHPEGPFTVRDLMTVLPMLDSLCVLEVTGSTLISVLENGVSQYPKHEGRFPQVAGISFTFDPLRPGGDRVIRETVRVGDEPVDLNQTYRLCTKDYIRQGRDGYSMLAGAPVLQDDEQCPMLATAIQNHFVAIRTVCGKGRRNTTHRQSIVLLSRRHSLIRTDTEVPAAKKIISRRNSFGTRSPLVRSTSLHPPSTPKAGSLSPSTSPRPSPLPSPCTSPPTNSPFTDLPKRSLSRQDSVQKLEQLACRLAPELEGRIVALGQEPDVHRCGVIQEGEEPSSPALPVPGCTTCFPK